ncbi:unnamed protein product, partial [Adineta steineri]
MATDLGARLDKLVFDRKIKWKKPQPKEFAILPNVNIIDSESTSAIYYAILE